MRKPKRQHWVPRFYLKEFTLDKSVKLPKTWVLPSDGSEYRLDSIENIAVKSYLYSPADSQGNRNWTIEDQLADLEAVISRAWPLYSRGAIDLSNTAFRKGLSLFVSIMYLRHPCRKPEHIELHRQLVEFMESAPKDEHGRPAIAQIESPQGRSKFDNSDWENYRNRTQYYHDKNFTESIKTHATDIAEVLMEKRWTLVTAEKPYFVTSDNPVTLENLSGGKKGFRVKGTVIRFPVSPWCMLTMDDEGTAEDSRHCSADSRSVAGINYLTMDNPNRIVITKRHPDIVKIETEFHLRELQRLIMVDANPYLKNVKHKLSRR